MSNFVEIFFIGLAIIVTSLILAPLMVILLDAISDFFGRHGL